MELQYTTDGMLAAVWLIAFVAIPYLVTFIVWLLATQNLFWTVVKEGRAKAIMLNDKFHHCVMSLDGHIFAKENNGGLGENHPWDIVLDQRTKNKWDMKNVINFLFPFMKNIYWVGLPPFSKVYSYEFKWTSLEEKEDEVNGTVKKVPVTKEETLDYVMILEDVYFSKIDGAESKGGKENLPLDVELLTTGQITNPYKALFKIQHWLEASENQIGARVRKFFGTTTYAQILNPPKKRGASTNDDSPDEILSDQNLGGIIKDLKEKYGFDVRYVQLFSVDPGSELAKDFILASTRLYVAQEQAKADEAEGKGKAKQYKAISDVLGGKEMFVAEQIRDSSLTVVTSQGPLLPAINVADATKGGAE